MDEDLGTADPLVPNGGLVPNGTADGAPAKKQVRRVGAKPPVDRNGGNIQRLSYVEDTAIGGLSMFNKFWLGLLAFQTMIFKAKIGWS